MQDLNLTENKHTEYKPACHNCLIYDEKTQLHFEYPYHGK